MAYKYKSTVLEILNIVV